MHIFSINGNVILQLNMMHVQNIEGSVHTLFGVRVERLEGTLRLNESKHLLHTVLQVEQSQFLRHLIMVLFEDLILFDETFNY
jgi:hypothetical protein